MKQHVDSFLAGIAAEGQNHEPDAVEPIVEVVVPEVVPVEGAPIEPIVSNGEGTEVVVEGQEPEIKPEGAEVSPEPAVAGEEVVEELVFDDWDDDEGVETPAVVTPPTETIFSDLKEVVGDEVSDVTGLKEFISTLKKDNSTLKEKANQNPLENVPNALKEAVELAQDGRADYLELLNITSVDYSQLDPATLAESDIRQYFYSEDGQSFDEDGFISYIDNIPEKELEIRGKQRIGALVQEQNAKKNAYLENVKREKQVSNDAIERAVSKLDKVADFKLSDGHKSNLAKAMRDGGHKSLLEPRNSHGDIDYNELAEIVFIKQNFKKMMSILKTKTQNSLKGEVLADIGNHTVAGLADKAVFSPDTKVDPMDAMITQAQGRSNRNSINNYYEQIKK